MARLVTTRPLPDMQTPPVNLRENKAELDCKVNNSVAESSRLLNKRPSWKDAFDTLPRIQRRTGSKPKPRKMCKALRQQLNIVWYILFCYCPCIYLCTDVDGLERGI